MTRSGGGWILSRALQRSSFKCLVVRDERVCERELGALGQAMHELRTRRALVVTWLDEAHTDASIEIIPAWRWLLGRV